MLADTEGVERTVTPVRNAVEPFFNDQATGSLIVCLLAEASFAATAFVTHRPEHQLVQTRPGVVTVPSALRACRKPSPFCLPDCLPPVRGLGRLLADTEGVEGTVTPARHAGKPFFNDQPTGSLIVCLLAEVSFAATAFVTHRPEHQLMQTRPGVVTVLSALRACRKPSPFCLSDCLPAVPRYAMPFFIPGS